MPRGFHCAVRPLPELLCCITCVYGAKAPPGRENLFDFPGCSQKPDKEKVCFELFSLEQLAFPGRGCSTKETSLIIRPSGLWLGQWEVIIRPCSILQCIHRLVCWSLTASVSPQSPPRQKHTSITDDYCQES